MIGFILATFSLYRLGEATVWPVLQRRTLTLDQMNAYTSASRGSLPSLGLAISSIHDLVTVKVILCTAVLAAVGMSNQTIVGCAYEPGNATSKYIIRVSLIIENNPE